MLLRPLGHTTAGYLTGFRQAGSHAVVAEERLQELGGLLREHAGGHLRAVVQTPVADDVPQRPDGTGLLVPRAEDKVRDPGQYDRPRAHRAGFKRDVKRAVVETPLAPSRGGLA